jgi:hypothetical protein
MLEQNVFELISCNFKRAVRAMCRAAFLREPTAPPPVQIHDDDEKKRRDLEEENPQDSVAKQF